MLPASEALSTRSETTLSKTTLDRFVVARFLVPPSDTRARDCPFSLTFTLVYHGQHRRHGVSGLGVQVLYLINTRGCLFRAWSRLGKLSNSSLGFFRAHIGGGGKIPIDIGDRSFKEFFRIQL